MQQLKIQLAGLHYDNAIAGATFDIELNGNLVPVVLTQGDNELDATLFESYYTNNITEAYNVILTATSLSPRITNTQSFVVNMSENGAIQTQSLSFVVIYNEVTITLTGTIIISSIDLGDIFHLVPDAITQYTRCIEECLCEISTNYNEFDETYQLQITSFFNGQFDDFYQSVSQLAVFAGLSALSNSSELSICQKASFLFNKLRELEGVYNQYKNNIGLILLCNQKFLLFRNCFDSLFIELCVEQFDD